MESGNTQMTSAKLSKKTFEFLFQNLQSNVYMLELKSDFESPKTIARK